MLRVGLTGGIGCGKTTVSEIIKEKGIPVVDADIISRRVLEVHPEILIKIREHFGEDYFDEEGKLLRRKMGNLIFSNKDKKKEYENIIMPYIADDIFNTMDEYDKSGEDICILDAPTLIENHMDKAMDFVIVIAIERELQIARVMARDEFTREEAIKRIDSQMSTKEKIKYGDFIIDNSKTIEYAKHQIDSIIMELNDFRGKDGL